MQIVNQQTNQQKLNTNDILSLTQYYKVSGKAQRNGETVIHAENENGDQHTISSSILELNAWTANQTTKEVYVNREEMTHIFQLIGGEVFTVNYVKQTEDAVVNKSIKDGLSKLNDLYEKGFSDTEANPSDVKKIKKSLDATVKQLQKEITQQIKEAVDGETRTLIGYKYTPIWNTDEDISNLLKVSANNGRVSVIDLEQPKVVQNGFDKRYRLVDVRTIQWLIWRNIKFIYGKAPK